MMINLLTVLLEFLTNAANQISGLAGFLKTGLSQLKSTLMPIFCRCVIV